MLRSLLPSWLGNAALFRGHGAEHSEGAAGEDDALNPEPDAQSNGNNGSLDFEAELCIVIGKRCRNATRC
jgi:2-keto-4-pentenoate hydratase/2-oxohepta-3-ene-1,7-dioic acid hydratase in catechol pathway